MNSTDSSSFSLEKGTPIKSKPPKTPLKSKTPNTPQQKTTKPPTPVAARTPDLPPPRLRNRRAALSLKDVRRAALAAPSDVASKSARRQIVSWPEETSGSTPSSSVTTAIATQKVKSRSETAKFPEKYETLVEFFNCLDSSIRLLRIRGSMSTFSNISPQIQSLTNRTFSYEHLAQLKYILPEAIELKRTSLFDERTCCMKPDILVTFDVKAIECDEKTKPEIKNAGLRKLFRARIAKFYKDHPEGDDIPQEMLPEPFNRKQSLCQAMTEVSSSSLRIDTPVDVEMGQSPGALPTEPVAPEEKPPAPASHLSRSFRRSFSNKVFNSKALNSGGNLTQDRIQESVDSVSEPCLNRISSIEEAGPSPLSESAVSYESSKAVKSSAHDTCSAVVLKPCLPATPIKESSATAELAATPSLSYTPGLSHPKRCYMSPDNESVSSPNKLLRRPPPTKSLKFDTPVKNTRDKQMDLADVTEDDDILKIFPEKLLKSIQEKEKKAKEEKDPAISQAKRRKLMISRLPRLFNTIHFLFQSKKQSVITKKELIHKITADRLDIADSREIEEQLNLLVELVPEWISEKITSVGDLLLCINKMSSPETIRARLEGAK
ncbi:hypothetical protein Tsubulata_002826 [Turnera subulata]|uniref:CDT1 Geminin-binding domain-containing protein n=1 Tax=Turnera subulata TaxID=218843 RepID=A0A9Q0IWJ7_9ROSI|nr:hypothetical protein Tsubulata_002826 [Turnera subulata]